MGVKVPSSSSTSTETGHGDADAKAGEKVRDFSNGWVSTVLACAIWLLVSIANVYVLTTVRAEVADSVH